MKLFNRIVPQDGAPFRRVAFTSHPRPLKTWASLGGCAVLLLLLAACDQVATWPALIAGETPAAAPIARASPGAAPIAGEIPANAPIAFYSGILDPIRRQDQPAVRPSTLYLTEDGSVTLDDLRWSNWGASVARATGVWSASDCTPNCAQGKLTKLPARLTLSSPGVVNGRHVYRCFQIDPPRPRRDPSDHGCIGQEGAVTDYVSVSSR